MKHIAFCVSLCVVKNEILGVVEEVVLHKDVLLKLLDAFVEVCKKNGLKYYLAGGSVLGAVRHQGFIPWDDDIDVYMPRRDYETLQQLPGSVWGSEMRLASWRTTLNYRYDFLKVELVNTTLIERIYPNYVGGVFMDIFPLDLVPDDEQTRLEQLNRVRQCCDTYMEAYLLPDGACRNFMELWKLRRFRRANRDAKVLDEWENLVSAYVGQDCARVVDYHSPWMDRPMPKEYIGEGQLMLFEGKEYVVPSDVDRYLTHVYGDYMTLPPVEKRYGHCFDYVNYERRLSDREIKVELKRIRKKYAYPFSLKKEVKAVLRKLGFKR